MDNLKKRKHVETNDQDFPPQKLLKTTKITSRNVNSIESVSEVNKEIVPNFVGNSNYKVEIIQPGFVFIKNFLTLDQQHELIRNCFVLGKNGGFYCPDKNIKTKYLKIMCLGMHFNTQTYKYEKARNDFDGRQPQPIPELFKQMALSASNIATVTDSTIIRIQEPDICFVNYYDVNGKLGMHMDKKCKKNPQSPVVSVSLGETGIFCFKSIIDKSIKTIELESGDAIIFGGESRKMLHGVRSIIPGTFQKLSPEFYLEGVDDELYRVNSVILDDKKKFEGIRLNLTFREI